MSQQINLLNPALIKQRDFLNPNNIAITLGLLLVFMLGYYGYAQKQLSLLSRQRSQIAEELSATQAQLKQIALLHMPHEINKALQDQIIQLEQKETMQQQILQIVNQSSTSPEKGYAALMRAFAKQRLDGIWITSFSIDSNADKLNISGRTLRAELLPEYIFRLGNEPALKGKSFASLNMSLPKTETTPARIIEASASNQSSTTLIKNGKSTIPTTSSINDAGIQSVDTKYLEFALQASEEKTGSITRASVKSSINGGKS